jgi:tetrahydromethanopterin S-methyltransferase subunit E
MTEAKLAKIFFILLGTVIALLIVSQISYSLIHSTMINSNKELNLFLGIILSFSQIFRTYSIFICVSLVCLWGLLFWIWMLIDCVKKNFPQPADKVIWFIVVFFLNLLGALIYYFIVKKKA